MGQWEITGTDYYLLKKGISKDSLRPESTKRQKHFLNLLLSVPQMSKSRRQKLIIQKNSFSDVLQTKRIPQIALNQLQHRVEIRLMITTWKYFKQHFENILSCFHILNPSQSCTDFIVYPANGCKKDFQVVVKVYTMKYQISYC